MRRRLVLSFVTLVVTLVLLYGVPRAFMLSHGVREDGEQLVARGAQVSALLAADTLDHGDPVTADLFRPIVHEGERVAYTRPGGESVEFPTGSAMGSGDLVASQNVEGGGTVTYSLSDSTVSDEVVRAVLPLALLGLALIPLGVIAGLWLSRRMARPFSELAETARRMGAGALDVEVPHYGVPEADEIAVALRDSGHRLDVMLRRERDVAVNASHELRTPITALRLALEDVTQWPETPPDVVAELDRLVGEVDRLSEAVTTLLDARRRWSGSAADDPS